MSKLDTEASGVQSDGITESAASSTPDATDQHRRQCLRVHPGKESQKGTASGASAAPVIPSGPKVTLTDGMLTVDPQDAPLGAVLSAIHATAGFQLDIPRSEMDGMVFDQIGPLPVREALVQLLYGSGFNYIIQTAPGKPQEVTHVFVSPRTAGTIETAAAREPRQPADAVSEDRALYGGFEDPSPQEEPAPRPAVAAQAPPANAGNVPGVPAGFNLRKAAEEAHKSPAEMLDEMQKRQLEILDTQAPPQ